MTDSAPAAGVRLTPATLRAIFPKAPEAILATFVDKQALLSAAGINQTRQRLAYLFANVHHECGGFDPNHPTIKNLTENINYTAERMAAAWPNRFVNATAVRAKYGTATGWQRKAFDDIYGNRMGNRPGTSDGSLYIGRGGPQITGRDGYAEVGRRIGVDLVGNPERASEPALQPAIAAAFWDWKGMNRFADAGNFNGCVRAWNGGTNGLTDRQRQLARITPILQKADWGLLPETPANAPANDNRPAPAGTGQPSAGWAAFFNAIANLFRRAA